MPIAGSDRALMQARSGIARAGATRSGYFFCNLVITIGGVTRTSIIHHESVQITQNLNELPDTATFRILPTAGVIPTVGQEVVIGLGTAANREFAGQILRVRHIRREDHQAPWIEVECVDYTRLFDRRLITSYFENQSATLIVNAIVETYTSGFTHNAVESGLPTIDFLPATMDRPSQALRRIADLIGGGFRIDANRDVHFWGSSGESSTRRPTPPQTLTNSLTTLKTFEHGYDASQIRTRIQTETKGAQTTADVAVGQRAIPVEDANAFDDSGGTAIIAEYGTFSYGGINTETKGTTASSSAVIGATSLAVTDLGQINGVGLYPGWLLVGGRQYIYYTGGSAGNVTGIPSSGAGSITSAIASGEAVINVHFIASLSSAGVSRAIASGTYVGTLNVTNDTTEQTNLAAIEGGDGIHEHFISDRRFDEQYAAAIASGDLDAFSAATGLPRATWETFDMNARPGTQQVINLTVTDALSVTLTITSVRVWFPLQNHPPRRSCDASTVRLASFQDIAVLDKGR